MNFTTRTNSQAFLLSFKEKIIVQLLTGTPPSKLGHHPMGREEGLQPCLISVVSFLIRQIFT